MQRDPALDTYYEYGDVVFGGPPTLITSIPHLQNFLPTLTQCSIYMGFNDGRNIDLGRDGDISILTILTYPTKQTTILDIDALGPSAFTIPSPMGKTLKNVMQDADTTKYMWDAGPASEALWSNFRVKLAGVMDIQLLEKACRTSDDNYHHSLPYCVRTDLGLEFDCPYFYGPVMVEVEVGILKRDKTVPIRPEIVDYCAKVVDHLPKLRDYYTERFSRRWRGKATDGTPRDEVKVKGGSSVLDSSSKSEEPGHRDEEMDKSPMDGSSEVKPPGQQKTEDKEKAPVAVEHIGGETAPGKTMAEVVAGPASPRRRAKGKGKGKAR